MSVRNAVLKYRSDIDGLRSFAVMFVVLFHAFPSWFSGGFIGVDVFFVISGYLISGIIFSGLNAGTFSFSEFYSRRIRRIFPVLIIVLALSLIAGWFLLLADEYTQLGKHVAGGSVFVSNFLLWDEVGYFDRSSDLKPLLHLWSLGVEEQFYVFWPFVLWLVWTKAWGFFWPVFLVFSVSFVLNIFFVSKDQAATFFWPLGRFWELLAGSLLAWIFLYKYDVLDNIRDKSSAFLSSTLSSGFLSFFLKVIPDILSLISFSILFLCLFHYHKGIEFPGMWAVAPVVATLLIIAVGSGSRLNRILLMNPVAVWFGLISYSLYLWHWPLLSFLRIVEERVPSFWLRSGAVILSVVLASVTTKTIEKYYRGSQRAGKKALGLVVCMALVGGTGLWVYLDKGFIGRVSTPENTVIENLLSEGRDDTRYYNCSEYLPEVEVSIFTEGGCKLLKPGRPDVLFVGDSHTGHYIPSLVNAALGNVVAVIQGNSCLPYAADSYMSKRKCQNKYEALVDFLDKTESVKTVFLSAFWNKALSAEVGASGINWRLPEAPEEADIASFKANMENFLQVAMQKGRRIVFMKDVPTLDFDIRRCFHIRPVRISAKADYLEDCSLELEPLYQRDSVFSVIIDDLVGHYPDLVQYDPSRVLCDNVRCYAKMNGLPLYHDGDHLSSEGGRLVVEDLVLENLLIRSSPSQKAVD